MSEQNELQARARALEYVCQYLLLDSSYREARARNLRSSKMSVALPELIQRQAEHIAQKFPNKFDRAAMTELEGFLEVTKNLVSGQSR